MSLSALSITERAFAAINEFPAWLESFDALRIPAWSVLLLMTLATVGFIFAIREFLAWFLKTNAVIDEVIRLESLVKDLQGDLTALESTVTRLQSTAGVTDKEVALAPEIRSEAKPQFPLNH